MGTRTVHRKTGVAAALAAMVLGWILLLPLATPNPFVRWSVDLLQLILPDHGQTNIVIVLMDEQAMRNYGQEPGTLWPRSLHARLLDRLTKDRPKAVVFDVELAKAGDPGSDDDALVKAMNDNGRVVLAGGQVNLASDALTGFTVNPPAEQFSAFRWGIAKVLPDPDRVGRRYLEGPEVESLAWAAASVAQVSFTSNPLHRLSEERWLNYYGSSRPFRAQSITYTNAESAQTGFFRDKVVFIGGHPDTQIRGDIADVFGTPFTKWNGQFAPGVELIAIAYANLAGEQWLRRTGLLTEVALLGLTGILASLAASLGSGTPRRSFAAIGGLAAFVIAVAVLVVLQSRFWFPWAIAVSAQIPCVLLIHLYARSRVLAVPRPAGVGAAAAEGGETKADGRPEIPDQVLIRCIGEGAYGQVWIARNTIGLHHAVKVIYRSRFGTEVPYERALRGIQRFMPISRSHEGFIHLLHVGRNDRAGFFFYLMEAGDDAKSGQQFDPAVYSPKTLSSELKARGPLPPRESLQLLMALTDAVERLHQHQLVHRDIKPDNIIFVHGRPKLADIDLVTSLSGPGEVSHIGTEGYLAPEGPGTAAADVFSLGRVLYVALTGKPPIQCPELPTQVTSQPDCSLYFEINRIICKACEFAVERRYPSAAAMQAELRAILERLA